MKYALLPLLIFSQLSLAQEFTYTTFNAKEKAAFIKRWKISEEEYQRFLQIMRVEGQFRYNGLRVTPLDILGITAESEELMQYYAKKAAKEEREAVKKQIRYILLTTQYKKAMGDEERAEAAQKVQAAAVGNLQQQAIDQSVAELYQEYKQKLAEQSPEKSQDDSTKGVVQQGSQGD